MARGKTIWAIEGHSLCAPESTIPALWAALGAGADGLFLTVQLTKDGVPVCCRNETAKETCGDPTPISDLTLNELQSLDAGKAFRSTALDSDGNPVSYGQDNPWSGGNGGKIPLYHPSLEEVLRLFSRRARIVVAFPEFPIQEEQYKELASLIKETLQSFGADHTTAIVVSLGYMPIAYDLFPADKVILSAVRKPTTEPLSFEPKTLMVSASQFDKLSTGPSRPSYSSYIITPDNGICFSKSQLERLSNSELVSGYACTAVDSVAASVRYDSLIAQDSFSGTKLNRSLWVCGFSKTNQDTKISQDDGLQIKIAKDGEYSGAAAVTAYPVHEDFDARVAFTVANPQQGTTFEIAAIQVDPGYHHMDSRNLTRKDVNLTFDVHGAPPYASSERDENDGFRIGWNNGPAVTQFSKGEAQSSNIYNKYSRDVGDGTKKSPAGYLRLTRRGNVFNAYYKDMHNSAWVLSGTALVATLAPDVFIRLAAKHWPKAKKSPPANTVVFSHFELYQSAPMNCSVSTALKVIQTLEESVKW